MTPLTLAGCLAALGASLLALRWLLVHLMAVEVMRRDAVQAQAEERLTKALKAVDERVARLELARLGR